MAQRSRRGEKEEDTFRGSEVINGPEPEWKTEGKESVASPILHVSRCSMFSEYTLARGLCESVCKTEGSIRGW